MCDKWTYGLVITGKKMEITVIKYKLDKKTGKMVESKFNLYLGGDMQKVKRRYVKEMPKKESFKNLLYYEKNKGKVIPENYPLDALCF